MLQLLRHVRATGSLMLGVLYCFVGRLLPSLRPATTDLHGKTIIVTGGNSGVGYGIAVQLAQMGARVFLAYRNKEKAEQARASMLETCGPDADIRVLILDNASLASVRSFASSWTHGKIDVLVHNAGIAMRPDGCDGSDDNEANFTEDGFEIMYQVNFLSSFLLTALLDVHLAPDARVIFTTSVGGYVGRVAAGHALTKTLRRIEPGFHVQTGVANDSALYAQTKLMQSAYARALQARYAAEASLRARRVFSFEPGLVLSNVFMSRPPFTKDPMYWFLVWLQPKLGVKPLQGAATAVHLATSGKEAVVGSGGRYFDRMKPRHHFERLDKLWIRWMADAELSA